jgi:hypothetical protein
MSYSRPIDVKLVEVFVLINLIEQETLVLRNVLSVSMEEKLVNVLRDNVGRKLGWLEDGQRPGVFIKCISTDPRLDIEIDTNVKPVVVRRIVTQRVNEKIKEAAQSALTQEFARLEENYNTSVNELLNACYVAGMYDVVWEMNGNVVDRVDEINTQLHTHQVILYAQIEIPE